MIQIESRWPSRRLSDCGEFFSGGTPDRSESAYWNGSIPWISAKSLKVFNVNESEDCVTEEGAKNGTRVVPAGTVLFVVRGMSLANEFRVGVSGRPVAFNQDVRALVPAGDVDAVYLTHFLRSYQRTILGLVDHASHGTARVTSDRLDALQVPVPPLPEQRRIAEVLGRAEALRAKRRAGLSLLDTLAQSIFLDLFGDLEGRTWPTVTVEEMAAKDPASIRTGPFGSQLLHDEFVDEGIAVLGIDNVVQNEFLWGRPRFITEEKYLALRRYTVRPRDVLITIMGTCGRCAIVPSDIGVAINTKHLCCISLDPSICLPEFLHAYFLRHPVARRHLAMKAKGAIMEGLNMGIIRAMPIPMPPIAFQQDFVRRISAVEKLKSAHRASLAQLDALFASLQHRAFRGEL